MSSFVAYPSNTVGRVVRFQWVDSFGFTQIAFINRSLISALKSDGAGFTEIHTGGGFLVVVVPWTVDEVFSALFEAPKMMVKP